MADSEHDGGEDHGREAERLPSNLQLEFRVPISQKKGTGEVRNLSSSGAQFVTYENLAPGTKIHIRIPFVNENTPPLMAPMRWPTSPLDI